MTGKNTDYGYSEAYIPFDDEEYFEVDVEEEAKKRRKERNKVFGMIAKLLVWDHFTIHNQLDTIEEIREYLEESLERLR